MCSLSRNCKRQELLLYDKSKQVRHQLDLACAHVCPDWMPIGKIGMVIEIKVSSKINNHDLNTEEHSYCDVHRTFDSRQLWCEYRNMGIAHLVIWTFAFKWNVIPTQHNSGPYCKKHIAKTFQICQLLHSCSGRSHIQSSAVITQSSITWYCIRHRSDWFRI